MKKIILSIPVFLVGALMIYFTLSENTVPTTNISDSTPKVIESNEETFMPEETAGQYAVVNTKRLQTLAKSDYKGPSYKVSIEEINTMIASRKINNGRLPASENKNENKENK